MKSADQTTKATPSPTVIEPPRGRTHRAAQNVARPITAAAKTRPPSHSPMRILRPATRTASATKATAAASSPPYGRRGTRCPTRDYPTLPSRLTPSSFWASTANSMGSSLKTSLQKPLTIMLTASSAEIPRCWK